MAPTIKVAVIQLYPKVSHAYPTLHYIPHHRFLPSLTSLNNSNHLLMLISPCNQKLISARLLSLFARQHRKVLNSLSCLRTTSRI